MFLPVILIDRYGWAGFFMFAVPNVIGCSAFGYVLKTPERSKALVEKYHGALASFAVVTVAFHAFFLAIVARYFISELPTLWMVVLPAIVLSAGLIISFLPNKLGQFSLQWCGVLQLESAYLCGPVRFMLKQHQHILGKK